MPWFHSILNIVDTRRHGTQRLLFRQLALQYRVVSESTPVGVVPPVISQGLKGAIDQLLNSGEIRTLSWLELYDLESLIVCVMDDARLRGESWAIRQEFKTLATDELYQAYLDSKPPADPRDLAIPADGVRRDVENLLRKLHELRLGRSLLDVIRAYTTALTFSVTLLLIMATIAVAYASQPHSHLPVLLLVVVGGMFGAGLSMLQRLSQIPSKGDLVPRYPGTSRRIVWILTPLLSLSQGALAAIVLYFIFRAGLVNGPLFPSFSSGALLPTSRPVHGDRAMDALLHQHLSSAAQGALLLVWSLVAGTAERLVPDLLTRLADRAESSTFGATGKAQ